MEEWEDGDDRKSSSYCDRFSDRKVSSGMA